MCTEPYKTKQSYKKGYPVCMRVKCNKIAKQWLHNDALCQEHFDYEKDLIKSAVVTLEELMELFSLDEQ